MLQQGQFNVDTFLIFAVLEAFYSPFEHIYMESVLYIKYKQNIKFSGNKISNIPLYFNLKIIDDVITCALKIFSNLPSKMIL